MEYKRVAQLLSVTASTRQMVVSTQWNGLAQPSTSGSLAATISRLEPRVRILTQQPGALLWLLSKVDRAAILMITSTIITLSSTPLSVETGLVSDNLSQVMTDSLPLGPAASWSMTVSSLLTPLSSGAVWSSDSTCSSKAATCQDYVQNNPSAFESAYWTINSLKVYTSSGSTPAPAPSVTPTSSPVAPVAQPTTTEVASPTTPTPTPSATPSNVGLGSSTPGGPITENPTEVVTETSDGKLDWGPGTAKRDLDTPFNSIAEQPAVTKRSIADGSEEMYVKRGTVMRHLRRHQMGGCGHHHHS